MVFGACSASALRLLLLFDPRLGDAMCVLKILREKLWNFESDFVKI